VGTLLAAGAAGVLIGDGYFAPWFPCLFACLLFVGVFATRELVQLFPATFRPSEGFVVAVVCVLLLANWYDVIRNEAFPSLPVSRSPFELLLFLITVALLIACLIEMARYREPGAAVPRLALTMFAILYLGVLGSFFARLRWLEHAGLILTLTVFVPKCGDIGAFFTGTFLGKHKMTPILSPKKTWEGFAGGLLASMLTAIAISFAGPVFAGGVLEAAAFGLVVGVAGVLGDLAESLIKRDCQTKDAAKSIPGFGGLLDVVDSVLFAAPVSYLWFAR
jgi:phosphatidate cytidylyltransferase